MNGIRKASALKRNRVFILTVF